MNEIIAKWLEEKEFVPIPNLEHYLIDRFGNVFSTSSMKFLATVVDKWGNTKVDLSKSGNHRSYYVHRLIASIFIENPNNYYFVVHKNGDHTNNSIDNLLHIKASNTIDSAIINRIKGKTIRPVVCVETNELFQSITCAATHCNFKSPRNIYDAIRRNGKSNGYHWRYATECEIADLISQLNAKIKDNFISGENTQKLEQQRKEEISKFTEVLNAERTKIYAKREALREIEKQVKREIRTKEKLLRCTTPLDVFPEEVLQKFNNPSEHTFKRLPDYPFYWCDNFGNIWNSCTQKFIKQAEFVYFRWHTPDGKVNVARCKLSNVVASLFLPNPHEHKQVIFKDGNISNVRADNLMWRASASMRKYKRRISNPIVCTETARIYPSISYAIKLFGRSYNSFIHAIETGNELRNYHWRYATNDETEMLLAESEKDPSLREPIFVK